MHKRGGGGFPAPSPLPFRMRYRELIETVPDMLPSRHPFIENLPESMAMGSFYEMGHFMDDDVFEAIQRLSSQFCIEQDAPARGGATTPTSTHPPDL